MQREPEAVDPTAERVALWRALHVQQDAAPHVLEDELGLALLDAKPGWANRPDMDPVRSRRARASIVARARFVEDLIVRERAAGVAQYVLLGAGLDTFAQRRDEVARTMHVFEVDRPEALAFKRRRLHELGFGVPGWLSLVGVDFTVEPNPLAALASEGFARASRAVVASLGVSMYLTPAQNEASLRELASLAKGSTLVLSFMPPIDTIDSSERASQRVIEALARGAGTPFLSFFEPAALCAIARDAGFARASCVTCADLAARYFAGRPDELAPSSAEALLIAET